VFVSASHSLVSLPVFGDSNVHMWASQNKPDNWRIRWHILPRSLAQISGTDSGITHTHTHTHREIADKIHNYKETARFFTAIHKYMFIFIFIMQSQNCQI